MTSASNVLESYICVQDPLIYIAGAWRGVLKESFTPFRSTET